MKRLLVILLFSVSAFTSVANDYYRATENVNVRSGGGKQYAVSFVLQIGVEVEVLSTAGSGTRLNTLEKTVMFILHIWSIADQAHRSSVDHTF